MAGYDKSTRDRGTHEVNLVKTCSPSSRGPSGASASKTRVQAAAVQTLQSQDVTDEHETSPVPQRRPQQVANDDRQQAAVLAARLKAHWVRRVNYSSAVFSIRARRSLGRSQTASTLMSMALPSRSTTLGTPDAIISHFGLGSL
jgi:hypothetical protein